MASSPMLEWTPSTGDASRPVRNYTIKPLLVRNRSSYRYGCPKKPPFHGHATRARLSEILFFGGDRVTISHQRSARGAESKISPSLARVAAVVPSGRAERGKK